MSRFRSILLALDGSPQGAQGAGCALWLGEALGAMLHVVHATAHPLAAEDALARLRVAHAQRPRVIVHQHPGDGEAAVLEEIDARHVDLVVMSARGESAANVALAEPLGTVAQAVIKRSPVPVLLLPARYREALPWTSMLVAASGEAAADRALASAAQLAAALRLKVNVVHAGDGPVRTAALGAYADAPHHEYPHRLQRLTERGLARCTVEEAHCVDEVLLRGGDPASVLLAEAAHHGSSLVALGWHGAFGGGRALVLKRLLEEAECALLVIGAPERSGAQLKVGSEIDED